MGRYVITIHPQLEGVGLSKPGHWCNLRYPSEGAALIAAEADAGGPVQIERNVSRVRL